MFNADQLKRFFFSKTTILVATILGIIAAISIIVPIIVIMLEDNRQVKDQVLTEEEHHYEKSTKAFDPVEFESAPKQNDPRFDSAYKRKSSLPGNKYTQADRVNKGGKVFIKDGKAYRNIKVQDGVVYDQNGKVLGTIKDGVFVDDGNSSNSSASGSTRSNRHGRKLAAAPLSLYSPPSSGTSRSGPPQPGKYLPYGRWIPCVLSNTIETSSRDTPIIAVTTEAVYNQGEEVLPAGCEVHGYTGGMPVRDHVISQKEWTLVWRLPGEESGQEIKLKGTALENGSKGNGKHWKYSDGKLGIKGYEVDNRDFEKLQAIALEAISGAGAGLVSSQITTTGATSQQTFGGKWEDSLGEGLNKSASLYAELLLKKVMEDGYFVICPSGTKFYLYVEETILIQKSTCGGQPVIN